MRRLVVSTKSDSRMNKKLGWRAMKEMVRTLPFIAGAWLLTSIDAVAQAPDFKRPEGAFSTACGAVAAVDNVAGWLFTLFLALAVIFIIVAALFYLTAAGNTTQLEKAKNTLIYSIVAIVLALIAGGLTAIVRQILGGGAAGQC